MSEEKQILWDWSNDVTADAFGVHRIQLQRLVKKLIKEGLEKKNNTK